MAVRFYQKAADKGHRNAQFNLGVCYLNGQGVPKNDRLAFKYYHKAALQSDPDAEYTVGMCYLREIGTSKDEELGLQFLQRSAKQGNHHAQAYLPEVLKQIRQRCVENN